MRGDCNYREDASQLTYLKVFAQAMMMLSVPFKDGNCGGRRLNQYTVTLEIMNETKSTGSGNAGGNNSFNNMNLDDSDMAHPFPIPTLAGGVPMTGTSFGGSSSSASADTNKNVPIFSTASYGETEVCGAMIVFFCFG
jgi:hypothetical protein